MLVALSLLAAGTWGYGGAASAQANFRRVSLSEGVEVAIPSGLRELDAPALPEGAPGMLRHVYSDGAPLPLTVWLQVGAAQPISSLPAASDLAAQELAAGVAAGVPGAYDVVPGAYDPARGALRVKFKARGASASIPTSVFSGVAFLTKLGTVLSLSVAAVAREKDADLAASIAWAHSTVHPSALFPVEGATSAASIGRRIGVIVGSFLGALLLGGAAAWLLVKAGVKSRTALAIAGAILVAFGIVGIMRTNVSPDALLQLGCYVLASGLAHGLLAKRLERVAAPRRAGT